jgi:hypothetical protein
MSMRLSRFECLSCSLLSPIKHRLAATLIVFRLNIIVHLLIATMLPAVYAIPTSIQEAAPGLDNGVYQLRRRDTPATTTATATAAAASSTAAGNSDSGSGTMLSSPDLAVMLIGELVSLAVPGLGHSLYPPCLLDKSVRTIDLRHTQSWASPYF